MKRHLVLFTVNHPFNYRDGETMFVAPELPHLVAAFETVTLVPLHDPGAPQAIPSGVRVDRRLARSWSRGAILHAICALAWPGLTAEVVRALGAGSLAGAARAWRWAAVACATRAWLRRHASHREATLLYSYWRGGQCMAAVREVAEGRAGAAVTRVHGHDLYEDVFQPPFQPFPGLYRELARILTVSQSAQRYLLERGVDPARVQVARLGVAAARRRAGASKDGHWRIVSCGYLSAFKRVDKIAQGVDALARRHPRQAIAWTHFGDGAARAAVEARVRDMPGNVRVELRGSVPNGVVLAHYESQPVDLFLHLSEREGLPVSIQEALAHGIPVVACDVGGVAEAFDPAHDHGTLLPVHASIDSVVAALERLLLAPAPVQAARREQAWRQWQARFDAQHNHTRLAALLANL